MLPTCESVQEDIAWGRALGDVATAHAGSCPVCQTLASEIFRLDRVFAESVDTDIHVPAGFADRVMARIEIAVPTGTARLGLAAPLIRLLERRTVQIVLAHGAMAFAVTNLMRFVVTVLVPATSLGGGR
jgi:hypothetical protein